MRKSSIAPTLWRSRLFVRIKNDRRLSISILSKRFWTLFKRILPKHYWLPISDRLIFKLSFDLNNTLLHTGVILPGNSIICSPLIRWHFVSVINIWCVLRNIRMSAWCVLRYVRLSAVMRNNITLRIPCWTPLIHDFSS